MTLGLTPLGAVVLAACIVTETAREVGFKSASMTASATTTFARSLATTPALWIGFGFGVINFLLWIVVLQSLPLSIAFPMISLTYVTVPFAGMVIFREVLTRRQWLGAGLITIGVACVGASGLGG